MEIRPVDRLMLIMLSEIYDALKIEGEINTALVREAIFGGHSWALEWDLAGVTQVEETPRSVVKEVVDILDMHSIMEHAYRELSPADKARIDENDIKFMGFDGNNETEHMSVARMMIEKMGRWSEFKSRPLNSHSRTLDRKRDMVRRFLPIRDKLGSRRMTADEIRAVLA